MTTIVLHLHERHGDRIKVKELDSTAKDCFYLGLHKQYQPLVVHLKDKAHTTVSDLLRAIHIHDEAESNLRDRGYQYSSYRSKYDPTSKSGQDKYGKKTKGYTTKVTQLPDDEQAEPAEMSESSDIDENFEYGYCQGVIQAADMNDNLGRCFNSNEAGHKWLECPKPQWEGLKQAYERLQQLNLNYKGDPKRKGVCISLLGATAPAPVAVKV